MINSHSEEHKQNCENQCKSKQGCPTPSAHIRLNDAHRLWHQSLEEYSNPDGFRVNLNSCIQALRNVTWALQNEKSLIPDFDSWYKKWQEKMKLNPILKWLVQARNLIVKRRDLETKSVARVAIIASYLEPPVFEFEVKPFIPLKAIVEKIKANTKLPDHVRKHGFFEIERKWVARDLPNHELLDALAYVYGFLSMLIADAHVHIGANVPKVFIETTNGHLIPSGFSSEKYNGRLPCMVINKKLRAVAFKIDTGEQTDFTAFKIPVAPIETVEKKYGSIQKVNRCDELKEHAKTLFENARKIFLVDGYHVHIAMLFTPDDKGIILQLNPEDQADKYLLWSRVAKQVADLGSDRVIVIGEAWMAKFSSQNPQLFPSQSPDRIEILFLDAVSKEGKRIHLISRINRTHENLTLDKTQEVDHADWGYLEPIRRVWAK